MSIRCWMTSRSFRCAPCHRLLPSIHFLLPCPETLPALVRQFGIVSAAVCLAPTLITVVPPLPRIYCAESLGPTRSPLRSRRPPKLIYPAPLVAASYSPARLTPPTRSTSNDRTPALYARPTQPRPSRHPNPHMRTIQLSLLSTSCSRACSPRPWRLTSLG